MDLFVRVVAPSGRDAELITGVLRQAGVPVAAGTIASFVDDFRTGRGLGPLLVAEEALTQIAVEQLSLFIANQPSWSDLPLLILTGGGRESSQNTRHQVEKHPLGSPILLERPIRTATLVSSVKAALRARARQYQMRDTFAELQSERETLQAMLDNLPVGVLLATPSGKPVRGNQRLEEIVRHPLIPTPDLAGHAQWIAFHPDGRRVAPHEFPLPRAMQAGRSIPPEDFLYQKGDGVKGWIRLAAAPILNAHGEVTGGVLAVSDVDPQKRAELALVQSEKLAAVGRLAASISHEINNPLESVTNLLYLARQDGDLSENISNLLSTAEQELARVSQIVSHTLRFHRQSTNPRAISAQDLLEPPLGLYAGRLANANIQLEVQHRETRVVHCYEGEIRQVLNNLIGNAIDSMKRGGKLTIRTKNSRSWKDGRPGLRITVGDTGSGIDPVAARHIFDAFFTTKGQNGTGLGLWIAKGIVDKHFGSLHVFSKRGPEKSGTAFSLFLPANPSPDNAPVG